MSCVHEVNLLYFCLVLVLVRTQEQIPPARRKCGMGVVVRLLDLRLSVVFQLDCDCNSTVIQHEL